MAPCVRCNQQGFSLLEAIVALTLVATLGASLFAWMNSSLSSLNRVRDASIERSARLNIIEYCKGINPMNRPEGGHDFGAYRIEWKSQLKEPVTDAIGYPAGRGNFQIGFYDLKVQAFRAGAPWFLLELDQVGYLRVRQSLLPGWSPAE